MVPCLSVSFSPRAPKPASGFVSFGDSQDMIRALKEMNNKYVGNRYPSFPLP